MPLTRQQYADELLRHWQLLWPLGRDERLKRFAEIKLDYEYEEQLREVAKEMAT